MPGRSGKDIARARAQAEAKRQRAEARGQKPKPEDPNKSSTEARRPKGEKKRPWLTPLLWVLLAILIIGTLWTVYHVMIVVPKQGMDQLKQSPQSALPNPAEEVAALRHAAPQRPLGALTCF